MDKNVKLRKEQLAFSLGYSVTPKGLVVNSCGEPVKVTVNDQGYAHFGTKDVKNVTVHRFQAFMKFGKMMYQFQCVRHLDGCRLNNAIDNIAVGSFVDNYHDVSKYDRDLIIKKMSKTKRSVSDSDVLQILKLKREGVFQSEIAKRFSLSKSYVSQIVNGKRRLLINNKNQ